MFIGVVNSRRERHATKLPLSLCRHSTEWSTPIKGNTPLHGHTTLTAGGYRQSTQVQQVQGAADAAHRPLLLRPFAEWTLKNTLLWRSSLQKLSPSPTLGRNGSTGIEIILLYSEFSCHS